MKRIYDKIPNYIKDFSNYVYRKYNKKIYICGGFVRDILLGLNPNDIDICSALTPNEIKNISDDIGNEFGFKLISDEKYKNTMLHGTSILYFIKEKYAIEHTTFRSDVSTDGRNASIEFSKSIYSDSIRRDFTINALYYDIQEKLILDFWNGLLDLKNRELKFIGNPITRIYEDNLRLIRYYRFIHNLNLTGEKNSRVAVYKLAFLLSRVSTERVYSELKKVISNEYINVNIFYEMLNEFNISEVRNSHKIIDVLIEMMLCRFTNPAHITSDVLSHSFNVVRRCNGFINSSDKNHTFDVRFCALFHDILKLNNKEWDSTKNKHKFIGHDNIIEKNNINLLNDFKSKSNIPNYLYKDLKFVIETHMMVWNCDNKNSIFKFIYNKLNNEKNIERFYKYYPIYIGDCKVEKSPDKFEYIISIIDDIKSEIPVINDIIKSVNIREYISLANDKSKLGKLKYVVCKNKYINNRKTNRKECLNILNG